jgi:GT2 family glycosyltransferase
MTESPHPETQPGAPPPAEGSTPNAAAVEGRLAACERELAALEEACAAAEQAISARDATTQATLRDLRATLRTWRARRSTQVVLRLAGAKEAACPYGTLRGQVAGYAGSAASMALGEAVHAARTLAFSTVGKPRARYLAQAGQVAEDVQLPTICRPRQTASVSVIVPVYNAARADGRYLVEALESVAAQDPGPHDVIVVDDGSTDGSGALVEAFIATHPQMDVRLVRQENGGQSSARNRGAELATGEWLAFLDQDDVWLPAHLRTIAPHLTSDVDLVYTDADMVDQDGVLMMPGIHARYGLGGRHPKTCLEDVLYEDIHAMPGVTTIRRSTFTRIGGFDERLSGCEDDDLFVRALLAGPVQYVPVATLRWRMYPQSYGQSDRMIRSRLLYWRKLLDQHARVGGDAERARRISLRFVFVFLSECSRRLDEDAPLTSEYLEAAHDVLSTLGPVDQACFALVRWAFRGRGRRAALARYWFLTGMQPARPQPLDLDPERTGAG